LFTNSIRSPKTLSPVRHSPPSWPPATQPTAQSDRSKPQDLRPDRSEPQDLPRNSLRQNHLRHNHQTKTLRRPKPFARKHLRPKSIVLTDAYTIGWFVPVVATRLVSTTYSNTFCHGTLDVMSKVHAPAKAAQIADAHVDKRPRSRASLPAPAGHSSIAPASNRQ
jgi:hypothetical protein